MFYRFLLVSVLFCFVFAGFCGAQTPVEPIQPPNEPVVARVEMKLTVKEEVVDVIEKGDLLTVLEDRDTKYLIQTHNGVKGVVLKVNAVLMAESSQIYTDLIEAAPENGRLYTLRASAWFSLGDNVKALEDFDKAIQLGYKEPHAYSSRGLFYSAVGEFEKAILDHTEAIEQQAKLSESNKEVELDAVPFINRAAAYLSLDKTEAAIADYSRAIEIRPEDSVLYQQRAIAKKQAGKLDEAIEDFNKTIALEPDAIPALIGRGFVYFQQSKHEQAIEDFSKVIDLNPEAAVAFNNRGYNYQQIDKYQAALEDYRKATTLAPEYALAFQNMAWLLAVCEDDSIRDPSAAVVAANKACELSDYKNVSDLAALAAALAADGKFEEAIGWQEKVVAAADESQKEYTEKILDLYKTNQQFDPTLIDRLGATNKVE